MSDNSVDFDLRDIKEKKAKKDATNFEPNRAVGLGTIAAKNGDVFTGSPNMVWVQTDDGLTSALLPMGNAAKPVAGTPIRFSRDPKQTDPIKITGINSDSAAAYGSYDSSNSTKPHWFSHHYQNGELIGADAGLIHVRMLEQGRLTAIGGYRVAISPFSIYRGGARWPIQGKAFDLELDKPTNVDEQLWVTIYVDLPTAEYSKVVGAVYTGSFTPPYPTVPESALVLGSVRLRASATQVREVDIVDGRVPFYLPPQSTLPLDPSLDFDTMVNGDMLWWDATNKWYTSMGLTAPPQLGQFVAWDGVTGKPSWKFLEEIEDSMAREILSAPFSVTATSTVITGVTGKKIAIVGIEFSVSGPLKVAISTTANVGIVGEQDLATKGNGLSLGDWNKAFCTTAIDAGVKVALAQSLYNTNATTYSCGGIISYYLV